jgi:hypothetical protein
MSGPEKPSRTKLDDSLEKLVQARLDTDSENLASYTNKHDDWNLVFAYHEEEDGLYPLTFTEIANAQRKDRELKIYF